MPLQFFYEPNFLLDFVTLEKNPGLFIKLDEVFKRVRTDAEEKFLGSQFFVKRTFDDKEVFCFEVVERKSWEPEMLGLSV